MKRFFNRHLLTVYLSLIVAQIAVGAEVVIGAFRQSTSENEVTSAKLSARPGFGFGLRTQYDYNPSWALTAGAFVEQRSTTDIFNGVEHNPVIQYFDLPLQIKYNLNDSISLVAGANFWTLVAENCGSTDGACLIAEGPAKFVTPLHIGLNVILSENFGFEIFYEHLEKEFWFNTFKNLKSTGLNLKVVF